MWRGVGQRGLREGGGKGGRGRGGNPQNEIKRTFESWPASPFGAVPFNSAVALTGRSTESRRAGQDCHFGWDGVSFNCCCCFFPLAFFFVLVPSFLLSLFSFLSLFYSFHISLFLYFFPLEVEEYNRQKFAKACAVLTNGVP